MAGTEYVIRGNQVFEMQQMVVANERDFLNRIKGVQGELRATPALPTGTRFYASTNRFQHFIVELRPGIRELHFQEYAKEGGIPPAPKKLKLSMPWQYFIVNFRKTDKDVPDWAFTDFRLVWAQDRVQDVNSYVYVARLPNIDTGSGKVCLGDTMPSANMPLSERIEELVNAFFSPSSIFNRDLDWILPPKYGSDGVSYVIDPLTGDRVVDPLTGAYKRNTVGKGYSEWVTNSKENPHAWMKWDRNQLISHRFRSFLSPEGNLALTNTADTQDDTLQNIIRNVGEALW